MRAALTRRAMAAERGALSELLRRVENHVLLRLAEKSFGVSRGRGLLFVSADEGLRRFAAFSAAQLDAPEAETRPLYENAYALGRALRRLTGLKREEELRDFVFWLYRNIRIRMEGGLPGDLTVSGCYFSAFYSPRQCALMSRVDAGIIAGLFGGGTLTFTERLSEGCPCCRAEFRA